MIFLKSIVIILALLLCGSSSVIEHNLTKVGAAGSIPVSRSIILKLKIINSIARVVKW